MRSLLVYDENEQHHMAYAMQKIRKTERDE